LQEKEWEVDRRGCRLCHRTCWGTPWEDMRLHEGANIRRHLRRHRSTDCRGDILAVIEAAAVHAHLLLRI
jgi:hypothetical protein